MEDLEQREGLCVFEERGEEGVVEAVELVVGEERRDEDDGAAEEGGPEGEGEGVVGEEVVVGC